MRIDSSTSPCSLRRPRRKKATSGWPNNFGNGRRRAEVPPLRPIGPSPTPLATPRGDLAGLLGASYPTVRLGDVILPPHLQDELAYVVAEARMTERLEAKGLRPRRRLLLAGPPGTGKTLTASALAGELKYPLFTVLLHGIITKFMGETAQKLRLIFDAVRTARGIYLFDEIDALAAARGTENDVGEARRILNSFLQFLDEDTGPSIVIATTIFLKATVFRLGRFGSTNLKPIRSLPTQPNTASSLGQTGWSFLKTSW
jgi:hypothetical protein